MSRGTSGYKNKVYYLSITSPEEENESSTISIEILDDSISELFPTSIRVRVRLTCCDSKTCVETQDSLFCPSCQISMSRDFEPFDVCLQLLVHVSKTRRDGNRSTDTEGQSMGLIRAMIRILSKNHNLNALDGTESGPGEDLISRRVNRLVFPLRSNEGTQT